MNRFWLVTFGLLWLLPVAAVAEMFVAPGQSLLRASGGALIQASLPLYDQAKKVTTTGSSLFIGQSGRSLFAPRPPRALPWADPGLPALSGSPVQRLRQLIQYAESRRDGYDAVQFGATIKPDKPPTQMTIGEIYDWIDATLGQPHAIGRYQFIPPTLRSLVKRQGLSEQHRFSPEVQDLLANALLEDAGWTAVTSGAMNRETFMHNLAKIWAGLPTDTGKSYYHGHAGNKAAITWAQYDTEMRRIFPG